MTYIFIHIPKTAGTTFLNIIKRNYEPNKRFIIDGLRPFESIDKFKSLSIDRKQSFQMIGGHFSLGLHEFLNDFSGYITYLRNPIDHFISTYYYIKRIKLHKQYEIANDFKNINDFICFRKKQNQDNLQTRHLSGIATDMEKGTICFDKEGDKYFKVAKENLLDKIKYVFVTDRMDESLLYLNKVLNWNKINYRRENVTHDRPKLEDFSKNTIEKIREITRYDIQLYELAREKHTSLINSLDINFESEILRFTEA